MLSYKLNFIPNTFVVIGAGGTGSRLMPLLAQFVKTMDHIIDPKIIVIDDDVVEEKNLKRQLFIKPDIGRPKAVVLCERYGRAFDLNMVPCVSRLTSLGIDTADLNSVLNGQSLSNLTNAIIIMAVDSAQSRKDIIMALNRGRAGRTSSLSALFIDAGNGDDFGQVQIFNPVMLSATGFLEDPYKKSVLLPGDMLPVDYDIPVLPYPDDFYNSIVDVAEKSCADLDQSLAINNLMAATIMNVVQTLLFNKRVNFFRVNATLTQGSTLEYITIPYLLKYIGKKPENDRLARSLSWYDFTDIFHRIETRSHAFKRSKGIKIEGMDEIKSPEADPKPVKKKLKTVLDLMRAQYDPLTQEDVANASLEDIVATNDIVTRT
jgi:hypothetical protein